MSQQALLTISENDFGGYLMSGRERKVQEDETIRRYEGLRRDSGEKGAC